MDDESEMSAERHAPFRMTINLPGKRYFFAEEDVLGVQIKIERGHPLFRPVSTLDGIDTVKFQDRPRGGFEVMIDGKMTKALLDSLMQDASDDKPFFVMQKADKEWIGLQHYQGAAAPPKFIPHLRVWPPRAKVVPAAAPPINDEISDMLGGFASVVRGAKQLASESERLRKIGRPNKEMVQARAVLRAFEALATEVLPATRLDLDVTPIQQAMGLLSSVLGRAAKPAVAATPTAIDAVRMGDAVPPLFRTMAAEQPDLPLDPVAVVDAPQPAVVDAPQPAVVDAEAAVPAASGEVAGLATGGGDLADASEAVGPPLSAEAAEAPKAIEAPARARKARKAATPRKAAKPRREPAKAKRSAGGSGVDPSRTTRQQAAAEPQGEIAPETAAFAPPGSEPVGLSGEPEGTADHPAASMDATGDTTPDRLDDAPMAAAAKVDAVAGEAASAVSGRPPDAEPMRVPLSGDARAPRALSSTEVPPHVAVTRLPERARGRPKLVATPEMKRRLGTPKEGSPYAKVVPTLLHDAFKQDAEPSGMAASEPSGIDPLGVDPEREENHDAHAASEAPSPVLREDADKGAAADASMPEQAGLLDAASASAPDAQGLPASQPEASVLFRDPPEDPDPDFIEYDPDAPPVSSLPQQTMTSAEPAPVRRGASKFWKKGSRGGGLQAARRR